MTVEEIRFPRTRGDGPVVLSDNDTAKLFPPHARGWTYWTSWRRGSVSVSPARAGMDPGRRGRQ